MVLNVLWVLFTLLGLGVLGIFPATAALVNVFYKDISQGYDVPLFETFKNFYKENFWQSNKLGLVVTLVGIFLFIDIRVSQIFIGIPLIHFLIVIVGLFCFIVTVYLFPVFARYELSFWGYFKQSAMIAVVRLYETLAMIVSIILLSILYFHIPIIVLFMGVSLAVYPITWLAYRACLIIESKNQKLNEKSERKS